MENFDNLDTALLRPRLVLYAYALSNGAEDTRQLAEMLGLTDVPETALQAWEQYAKSDVYAPLDTLAQEYGLDEFLCFTVSFALTAQLDESFAAVVTAVGGSITPVFAARLFSSSQKEAVQLRAQWILSENITELLFKAPQTLTINPAVLRFLLGINNRASLPRHLDKLASRIGPVFSWDNLVLPDAQKELLMHVCDRIRFDHMVYADWGFGDVTPYGRGVRALFSGPPGTGKTMAAQVIARELDMELYRVDISATVSKYIGETEKNLDEIFREAEKSGGILFFDEADAIFGKRGEHKDSHDKYANMQTSFLLQRIEEYDGALILATNLVSNFDAAFMRRIQVRVDFPTPDEPSRLAIWRGLLRPPVRIDEELDFEALAKSFTLTGSEIKNIVLSAAFIAAAQGEGITMRKIVKALEMEYAKTDKIFSIGDMLS